MNQHTDAVIVCINVFTGGSNDFLYETKLKEYFRDLLNLFCFDENTCNSMYANKNNILDDWTLKSTFFHHTLYLISKAWLRNLQNNMSCKNSLWSLQLFSNNISFFLKNIDSTSLLYLFVGIKRP